MVNITPDSVIPKDNNPKRESTFDATRYLSVFPAEGTKELKFSFRLLPIAPNGSPFLLVKGHDLKVVPNQQNFSTGPSKTFLCPKSLSEEEHCPICEANKYYWKLYNELDAKQKEEETNGTLTEEKKAKYKAELDKIKENANAYRQRNFYIVKVIQKGKEAEGPKYWRFPSSFKGDGVYDKIMALWNDSYYRAIDENGPNEESNWKKENIFDLQTGRWIRTTIKMVKSPNSNKEQRAFTFVKDDECCPIGTAEQIEKWTSTDEKWTSFYGVKSYDYLSAVLRSGGQAPLWDKDKGYYPKSVVDTVPTIETPVQPVAKVETKAVETPAPVEPVGQNTQGQAPVSASAPVTPVATEAPKQANGEDPDLPF